MRQARRRPTFGDVTAPTPLYLPVSFFVLGLVVILALLILMIGARSPYTHSNLAEGFDPSYVRTAQILVGAEPSFAGLGPDTVPADADALTRGAILYVTHGCASCHGLEGRGGPVGPRIAGADAATVTQRVRQGPLGMPRFSEDALTKEEIDAIVVFLRSRAPDR